MKKQICFLLMVTFTALSLINCIGGGSKYIDNQSVISPTAFAKGADISWLPEMEADGIKFFMADNSEADCYKVLKEAGINAIRLRVWVDSSKSPYQAKCCDKESVVANAERAKAAGMDIMIDFHYSDWFADPSRQETPSDWKNLNLEGLKEAISKHTTEILSSLRAKGITPSWIQIGNETRPGMLHPVGQLYNKDGDIEGGWANYVALSNAGYEAAKSVCPEALVMIHIDNAWDTETNTWWLAEFKKHQGKTDMIALSHYPQAHREKTWKEMNELALNNVNVWAKTYGVPVMISEVGVKPETGDVAIETLKHFMELMHNQTNGNCKGVFYWEPQVYGGWKPACYDGLGWPSYDMGGFDKAGKAGEIMKTLTK